MYRSFAYNMCFFSIIDIYFKNMFHLKIYVMLTDESFIKGNALACFETSCLNDRLLLQGSFRVQNVYRICIAIQLFICRSFYLQIDR